MLTAAAADPLAATGSLVATLLDVPSGTPPLLAPWVPRLASVSAASPCSPHPDRSTCDPTATQHRAVTGPARRPLRAGAAVGGSGAARSGAGARLARAGDGVLGERRHRGREAGERLLLPRAAAAGGRGGPRGHGRCRAGGVPAARPAGVSDAPGQHRPPDPRA